ncbi:MAG: class I SAM-dependent methyltransferase [Candidatus Cloacimonadota bacterium]|nr:class I SAM-dependent methyltransferase [Candidatus Cloacimonadota bacterium]
MHYDSIKDKFAAVIERSAFLRKLFYLALDMLFLRQWYIKREIKRNFPKNKKLCFYDAGAGFGQYSWFVLQNWSAAQVHAVDLKTNYMDSFVKFASKYFPTKISARQADLTAYVPEQQYDLVVASDILEHIADDRQVLINFRKALKPGGKLIISTPSNFDESAKFVAEHVRPGYSKEELTEKLQTAGFKVKNFTYSYGFWGHLYWILCLKLPLSLVQKFKPFLVLLPFYYLPVYPVGALFMQLDMLKDNKQGTGIIVVAE